MGGKGNLEKGSRGMGVGMVRMKKGDMSMGGENGRGNTEMWW